jgi:F-type H+-transporting ATPase subunit delta
MASVTSTYARAFADVVFDQRIDAGKALTEVQAIAQLVAANKPLREVWEAPSIPAEQKRSLLDAIVARERISRPVRNFIAVVIDHRRIKFLQPIVQQLERELNQRMGFTEAQIISARELSEPERRALETQVEKLTSSKVRARYAQDRALLGGAVVRVGSTIYDGSVRGRLERIRQAISS